MGVFRPFKKNKDVGIFLFRLFIGFRLLYGAVDKSVSRGRMQELELFLYAHNFPYPQWVALFSVCALALSGALIISGYKIRWAAVYLIINFLALIVVHWGQSIEEMTPALSMIFAAILFLFIGAGRYSLQKEPLVVFRK